MEANALDLISTWYIPNYFLYVGLAIIISIFIRGLSCLLKSIHTWGYTKRVWKEFVIQFKGFRLEGDHIAKGDFWFPTFIGILELLCFPVLMITKSWIIIGAWIGFKALPVWDAWRSDRSTFNRFLIGQVLVLIISAMLLTKFIVLTAK